MSARRSPAPLDLAAANDVIKAERPALVASMRGLAGGANRASQQALMLSRDHLPRVSRRVALPAHGVAVTARIDQVHLIAWAKALCARLGITSSYLSTIVFNDGKRLDAIADGAYLRPETLNAAVDRLTAIERTKHPPRGYRPRARRR